MRIIIVSQNTFCSSTADDDYVVGGEYELIPAEDGTDRQNRAWHSLLQEYWRSGCHSYNAINFLHFRELIKLNLGAGAEKYYSLVNDQGQPCDLIIKYRVKSWKDYTKKERKESIDRLIAEMIQAGINSRKFSEILQGMEQNSMRVAG